MNLPLPENVENFWAS